MEKKRQGRPPKHISRYKELVDSVDPLLSEQDRVKIGYELFNIVYENQTFYADEGIITETKKQHILDKVSLLVGFETRCKLEYYIKLIDSKEQKPLEDYHNATITLREAVRLSRINEWHVCNECHRELKGHMFNVKKRICMQCETGIFLEDPSEKPGKKSNETAERFMKRAKPLYVNPNKALVAVGSMKSSVKLYTEDIISSIGTKCFKPEDHVEIINELQLIVSMVNGTINILNEKENGK